MSTKSSQRSTTLTFDHLRGARYGEIFVVTHDANGISGAIYNSQGLNDLPQQQWQALNPDALKDALKADAIVLNGPRHWVMDTLAVEVPDVGNVVAFGEVRMRLVGRIRIPDLSALGASRKPYNEHTIERKTQYGFSRGKLVYELVAPDGKVYIMQASSQIVDPNLTIDQLQSLGSRLRTPAGWQFRARTIEQDFVLRTDGIAYIIQDELENTYQRVDS